MALIWRLCTLSAFLGCIAAASANNQGSCNATMLEDTSSCQWESSEPTVTGGARDDLASSSARTSATAAQQLQHQIRSQQLLLDVLSNVTSGAISVSAALDLLRDVAALRASFKHGAAAQRLAALKAKSEQQQRSTRGILIVAGGRDQFMNAYILLQLLRHPRITCNLPVELVYYGPQEYSPPIADAIAEHARATSTKVTMVDGSTVHRRLRLKPHPPLGVITGFKAKVHALTFVTSFDEVLLLDSDNTPLANPAYLFESEAYNTYGNIFWLDFWTNQWMKPVIYQVLGLDVPWEVDPRFRASEAGQIVINRVQHHDVLEYLYLLNLHSSSGVPGAVNGVVGSCLWGDKDTYRIAFSLAGKADLMQNVQHKPMQALSARDSKYVHAGMVQRGLSGELLFLHRTAAGKLWPHCALYGGATCVISGVTAPVDQQQLVASVQDVTMMELQGSNIDLLWQESHCGGSNELGAYDCVIEIPAPLDDDDYYLDEETGTETSFNSGDDSTDQPRCSPDIGSWTTADCDYCAVACRNTTLACDLSDSIGRLPIPVVAASNLPHQVQSMINVTYRLFLESLALQGT